jgi:hypothetical protein
MTETVKVVTEETGQFTLGVDASWSDGLCGHESRVAVDPFAHLLSHLLFVTHLIDEPNMSQPVTTDVAPLGEVTVRRGEHGNASDGRYRQDGHIRGRR